ncbi:MAG: transglutaminase domain-containing protein, partial [Myxococcales bacterium]|nr:transglutaminase domain-containing protein [Myxococcales bacterium]
MKPSKASKPSRPSGSPRRSALLVVALGAASLALGLDALVARAAPILHEYVPPPGKGDTGRWAREGRLPDHIRVEDRLLPKPRERGTADKGERVLGGRRASSKMDRATTVGPDRKTTHDGVLRYTAEFNPSVVPFKRMTALDSVTAEFRLAVRDSTPQLVPLAKRPTPPDRDPFWGSLVLEAKAGKLMAIPSVAPGAAIVSYRTSSADGRAKSATVSFYRDSADNMSIRTNVSGQLRVVFLTDAPRSYFSPEIPPLITIAQVPPSLRPLVPANVRSAANKVLAHIGVTSSQTMRRQLERLVAYFRNFEAKQLERRSGNTYLDIALSQRGVCRHRSYAFVITAQTAGIPARYVHNEAHAFAEAWVPRLGWLRIDLGGASSELRVGNAQRKAVHNAGPDPFPRPSRYAGNYSQLRGNVTGLRSNQRIRRTGTNLR